MLLPGSAVATALVPQAYYALEAARHAWNVHSLLGGSMKDLCRAHPVRDKQAQMGGHSNCGRHEAVSEHHFAQRAGEHRSERGAIHWYDRAWPDAGQDATVQAHDVENRLARGPAEHTETCTRMARSPAAGPHGPGVPDNCLLQRAPDMCMHLLFALAADAVDSEAIQAEVAPGQGSWPLQPAVADGANIHACCCSP